MGGCLSRALSVYRRPVFLTLDLVSPTSRDALKNRIAAQETRYNEFLNDDLLPAQRTWLLNAQMRGFNVDSADAFLTSPCMNDPTSRFGLEEIKTEVGSTGQQEVGRLLFIYMPVDSAERCCREQTLDYIPDHMRFMDFDDKRKMLATDVAPYATNSSIEGGIVERYHSVGCDVGAEDVTCCLVVPETVWTEHDQSRDVFKRSGFGPFDVLAIAPVLLPRTFPASSTDDEESD
ncbi:RolB family protein [Bradyrhizobium sp. CCGUVB23]|uniref:RolB family protein n=1 Tax=Bradyrhizobium sp. CCGUVB23 TaxID=2949630 RepID=UPI0020B3052F|nr:RolB family protein [Bradyrhizobium sp. CCGUVB23]MCP3468624.1 RolB family protein [Bradyrhizobium sp. CCGUVB23]